MLWVLIRSASLLMNTHNTVDSCYRPRLSQITTYLKEKILSLPKHENLTMGEKYPKEQFLLFSAFFSVYLYFQESNYVFICEMWLFYLSSFLNSANLICRDTDISKYFRESRGLRNNESQLYIFFHGEIRKKYVDNILTCTYGYGMNQVNTQQCRPRSKDQFEVVYTVCRVMFV